jgi:predicted HicB family RNase H-like nuclease
VDDYLEFCKERGESPEKPFSGRFVLRLPPNLHRRLAGLAGRSGESLNSWIVARLHEDIDESISSTKHSKKRSAGKKQS